MEIEYDGGEKKVIKADSKQEAIDKFSDTTEGDYFGIVVTDSAILDKSDQYPTKVHLVKSISKFDR